MQAIYPQKLKPGDEVRVIAPSRSLKIISPENQYLATQALNDLGLKVTFGQHANEIDMMGSSSVQSRVADLHDAFAEKNVKALFAVIGGSNSNQLLPYIDYELIKSHPKILCGFSDFTALQNAIYRKTGLVTYSGPQYSSFAMQKGFGYALEHFKKMLFEESTVHLKPSSTWSDDAWSLDQGNRTFHENEGYWPIHAGEAQGTIVGGNLSTFLLLHGTAYMPSLKNAILFLESDSITEGHCVSEFDRALQAVIYQPEFNHVKGLVLGRFEQKFNMDREKLRFIIDSKPELKNLPIIANADFGHTMPIFTFPIGGKGHMRVSEAGKVTLTIEKD